MAFTECRAFPTVSAHELSRGHMVSELFLGNFVTMQVLRRGVYNRKCSLNHVLVRTANILYAAYNDVDFQNFMECFCRGTFETLTK